MSSTITVTKSTHHYFTNQGEYADILISLGEHSVLFMAHSSFGTYAFHWTHTGSDPIAFLNRISFDYAMSKFRSPDDEVVDFPELSKKLFKGLIRERKAFNIDKDQARQYFEEIREICDNVSAPVSLVQYLLWRTEMSDEILDDKYSFSIPSKHSADCYGFWEQIWTPFISQLKA